jgi:hypothetical protein
MAKKPTPPDDLEPLTIGTDDEELTRDGVALKMFQGQPILLPLRIAKMPPSQLELVVALQAKVVEIAAAQRVLESLVEESRDEGLSWETIGWCIGRTGRAASLRFGEQT